MAEGETFMWYHHSIINGAYGYRPSEVFHENMERRPYFALPGCQSEKDEHVYLKKGYHSFTTRYGNQARRRGLPVRQAHNKVT